MKIFWTDDLSVGFKAIDDQHKTLINIINKFANALLEGEGAESIESVVNFLDLYTKVHFATEEKYMDAFNYPDIAIHKSEHKKLIDYIDELQSKVYTNINNHKLALDLCNELKDWYVNHIGKIDKTLGSFLKIKKAERNEIIEKKMKGSL
ncbi:MAG: hemerythrin-like metal-binding protein [Deferribacteraceae bacterium]|jgi:hemerythrin|nr:hemerythrin-like metal-binding protein [Deferribacteraceae bacterium]